MISDANRVYTLDSAIRQGDFSIPGKTISTGRSRTPVQIAASTFVQTGTSKVQVPRSQGNGAEVLRQVVGAFIRFASIKMLETVFLRAPAACWWARSTVESTATLHSTRPTASSRTWTCSSSFPHVPSDSQRANRS